MNNEPKMLYDLVVFPEAEKRNRLHKTYIPEVRFQRINVRINNIEYIDLLDEALLVQNRIKAYNYTIILMTIPLYHMLNTYNTLQSIFLEHENSNPHAFLFSHYSEMVAYYIVSAYEKSCIIFNEIYKLNVEVDKPDFLKRFKTKLKKRSESDKNIDTVYQKVEAIFAIDRNKEIRDIRNRNAHELHITLDMFKDTYDKNTCITTGTIKPLYKPEEVLVKIACALETLDGYSVFVQNVIQKYYE